MVRHGIGDWELYFNTKKSELGTCYYTKQIIELSLPWMAMLSLEECHDTILHEIAHALAHKKYDYNNIKGHGKEWKALCLQLGCTPSATYKGSVQLKIKQRQNGMTVRKIGE